MGMLRIHLFGTLRVTTADAADPLRITPVIQGLLAYLLINTNQPLPRDVLAELFWGNYGPEQARGCLNTALWRLRRLLESDREHSEGLYLVSNNQGDVVFNLNSPHWLDLEEFQARASRVIDKPMESASAEDVEACCLALNLYTGDLLEGIYDDWAIRQRERTRLLYLSTLAWLVRYFRAQHAYERSLTFAHNILEIDPLREEIQREVMRLYLLCGQRAQALRQYETCRLILQQEMGIAPMEETTDLYYQILNSEGRVPIPVTSGGEDSSTLALIMAQFQRARHTFEQAQDQFHIAMAALEKMQQKGK